MLPDTFNNEIIAHSVSPIAGDNKPHYQKMKADAEAGDPEAIRRYEATLAKRRDEYHKKKSRQEEVPAMKELKPRIHENGIDYILVGDYYVPDWKLPEEHRPIGRWGNLHRAYLRQFCPALYSTLVLSGELHTYLADLNEQATERCSLIIEQMAEAEGVDEAMKAENQMLWVQSMNSIRSRAEEIIMHELIYD